MDNFFKGISDTAGNIVRNVTRSVSPVVNHLTQQYNSNLRNIQNTANNASRFSSSLFDQLNTRFQSAITQPQRQNPIIGLEPSDIVKTLRSQTIDKPLFNIPKINLNGKEIKSPTVGEALDFAKSITLEPVARVGFEGAQTLSKDTNQYQFKEGFGNFLLGDEKLMNWNDPKRPSREFLRSTGMNEQQVNSLAPFLIFAGVALDVNPITGGKNKIVTKGGKEAIEHITKKMGEENAETALRQLLTYEDVLARMGYTEKQRAQFSVNKARELFQWDMNSAEQALKQARFFAGEKKGVFNKIFAKWIGETEVSKTTGAEVGYKFRDIPEKYRWDIVKLLDDPNSVVQDGAKKYIPKIRTEYDRLFNDVKKAGLDINYIKEYITHIWEEPAEVIEQKLKSASQKFKFAKERKIRTYQEGIDAGLTPKFNNPAEIIAEYTRRLEQTKANIKFVEALKKEGIIVDSAVGAGKVGFKPIIGSGFPVSKSKNYEGKIIEGQYYAPSEIADVINRVFEPESMGTIEKATNIAATVSKKLQEIRLSGGVPYTPLNAFSFTAGLQPEMLAFRFRKPLNTTLQTTFNNSNEYFKAKAEVIKEMQARNIPLTTTFTMDSIINKGVKDKLKKAMGFEGFNEAWDMAFNNKTFKEFFPRLQIEFYEDVKAKAMRGSWGRSKHTAEEASDIAAKATKNFYGIITTDSTAKASKFIEDIASVLFFAPKFRQQIIHKWINTAKSVLPLHFNKSTGSFTFNNPLSYENEYNTRFLAGAVLKYLLFDFVNHAKWGRHMWDNPTRYENSLLIDVGEPDENGKQNVIGLTYLPSLGTVPRTLFNMGKHTLEGEGTDAANDASSFLSIPLQNITRLATNRDYWGNEIRDPDAPAEEQFRDVKAYAYENFSHPFMGALNEQGIGLAPRTKDKRPPVYQSALKAMEVPVKFTNSKKLDGSRYYQIYEDVYKNLSKHDQAVLDQLKTGSTGVVSNIKEARLRLENPTAFRAEVEIAKRTAEMTGNDLHPLYKLPEPYQQIVLRYESQPPGSEKSAISRNNPWLKEYWNAKEQFFQEMGSEEKPNYQIIGEKAAQIGRGDFDPFIASEEIQAKLDHYYSLPKDTGQRTAYANANPDLVQYWNDKRAHDNKIRAELGLPPLENNFSSNSFSRGFKKQPFNRYLGLRKKKISVKPIKVKKIKIEPIKLKIKLPKYKMSKPKVRAYQYA